MSVDIQEIWKIMQNYADEQAEKIEEVEKKCCKEMYISDIEGFGVCTNCGVVKDNQVINDDIFSFDNDGDSKYLHSLPSILYPKSSLGTTISGNSKLAKIHSWNNMPYSERVIWKVSLEIKSKLQGYFSERVMSDSVILYKNIYEKMDINRGKNKEGLIAACVYFSAKANNCLMNISQLSKIMDVDTSTLNKSIKILSPMVQTNTNTAREFINPICDSMNISFDVRRYMTRICSFLETDQLLDGVIPQNVCIAVILFVCKEMGIFLDIGSISDKFKISKSTIKKLHNTLIQNKQYIFSRLV